ncbi:hypothetical protein [Octadecabacter ascidiaceicola]|uniref:Uncharacterized protein n=1 Tax=Octadecabacter ascidiaceicola TaxID=1655543 RepID=A0A238K2E3_9RHOB|nr:hypothetical protein [Octadecabacter ascidiaceicola]SMX37045.1 hypothetical protein OCA8868_01246 [Octadecabacter ascidiaceicola]
MLRVANWAMAGGLTGFCVKGILHASDQLMLEASHSSWLEASLIWGFKGALICGAAGLLVTLILRGFRS